MNLPGGGMKFYIASKLDNHQKVQKLAHLLKDFGWKHTFDWTNYISPQSLSAQNLRDIAQKELKGIQDADFVIVLTPQGKGTHVELGIAVALNKVVFLCHGDDAYFRCNGDTSAFYWLPNIKHLVGGMKLWQWN